MIIMGVDYGDARTGIAVCDKLEMLASGAGCIKSAGFKKTAEAVANRAKELGAELIVVGNPINMNGSEGPRSEKCKAFAAEVESLSGIKTVLYDERLTTVSAHRFLSDSNVRGINHKKYVDELSAQLILEDFMKSREREAKA